MKDINENRESGDERIQREGGKSASADRLQRGTILVASPMLNDPNFKRTAILILDKDSSGGYIGLILNRELDLTLEEVLSLPGRNGKIRLRAGGPVDLQRVFWIHSLGDKLKGSIEILPGLYVGGDYDEMIAHLVNSEEDMRESIRLYMGYSGWSAGQLEKEIEGGAWAVLSDLLEPQLLLEMEGEEIWNQLSLRLGPDYKHWRIIPADPTMN